MDETNFNSYTDLTKQGVAHIKGMEEGFQKGDKLFVKVGKNDLGGMTYTFISSSDLHNKEIPERLNFVRVPDLVMKSMQKQLKSKLKELRGASKLWDVEGSDKITKAIANIKTSRKTISISTRIVTAVKHRILESENKTKTQRGTESKVKSKLNTRLEANKQIKAFIDKCDLPDFPDISGKENEGFKAEESTSFAVYNRYQRVSIETGEKRDYSNKEIKRMYEQDQVKFAKGMIKLELRNADALKTLKEINNGTVSVDSQNSYESFKLIASFAISVQKEVISNKAGIIALGMDSHKAQEIEKLSTALLLDSVGSTDTKLNKEFEKIDQENPGQGLRDLLENTGLNRLLDILSK